MDFPSNYHPIRNILNDEVFGSPNLDLQIGQSTTFTCFTRLPAELRHQIWRYCLPLNGRLLSLRIVPGNPQQRSAFYKKTNKFGRIITNYPYGIRVNDDYHHWFLAMMLVNREASDILQSRYRLQMKAMAPSGRIRLYIDPETDVVEVFREVNDPLWCPRVHAIIAFLHDTVANDPRGQ